MSKKTDKIEGYNNVDRLRDYFNLTLKETEHLDTELDKADYGLLCKRYKDKKILSMFGCFFALFRYLYQDEESVLILFAIPFQSNQEFKDDEDKRHNSVKVLDIIKLVEDCFTTVDYMQMKDVKEDKYSYLVIIKKIKLIEGE